VFQEVSILALGKSEQILDAHHLLAWVRQAARLTAMATLRKQRRRGLPLDDAVLDRLEEDWQRHDRLPSLALLEALDRCLAQLTPRARKILELRYTQNLVGRELAAALRQPVASVYVALTRAHRAMERCVRQRIEAEEAR
jgi:RNA polymerase sigma factor (sigma-70 family)